MMRKVMAVAGGLVLALAWAAPPALGIEAGFTGHMIVHVAVVAVAAPLLAVGLAASRLDPTPVAPLLFAPMGAMGLEFVVVWGWHAPLLHAAARGSSAVFALEQASFLAVGLLVWLAAFGRGRGRGRGSAPAAWGAGILALFLTSMHMTLLGALLALSPRPLYGHAHAAGIAGLTPLDDQHLGGAVMLLVGGASYLIGGLVLIARLLRQPDPRLATTRGQGE
jgi:putative membrane protein